MKFWFRSLDFEKKLIAIDWLQYFIQSGGVDHLPLQAPLVSSKCNHFYSCDCSPCSQAYLFFLKVKHKSHTSISQH